MSFVDLMGNDAWSEQDIVARTEAMVRAVVSVEQEAILTRKVLGALLKQWVLTEDEKSLQAEFSKALADAHQAARDARIDAELLKSVLQYEAARDRITQHVYSGDDVELAAVDKAERDISQQVIDDANIDVVALFDKRNPPTILNETIGGMNEITEQNN